MEHKTWTTMDKAAWGTGPWQDEPDKEQFTDEATGLPCLVNRNSLGALCGYVGVSEGHPWFGKDYGAVRVSDDEWPSVHGGLTFADFCQEGDEAKTICHVPAPGEPDRVWWLGFDCAHHGDIAPGMESRERTMGWAPIRSGYDSYRTVSYVKAECASLAEQAAAAAVPAAGA